MTSYFRNLFGIPGNQPSSTQSEGILGPRSRSSNPAAYVYVTSPSNNFSNGSSRSGTVDSKRSNSTSATHSTRPSPLRGVYNDAPSFDPPKTGRSRSRAKSQDIPPYYQDSGRISDTDGPQNHIRAPLAPYKASPASSRTGSSASLLAGTPAVVYMHPLSSSTSQSINSKPSKSALKNSSSHLNGTASSTGYVSSRTRAHVTFQSPSSLHMHPLFAYSLVHRAPISYHVISPPSIKTVLDCTTHSPVPTHTLVQPATDPPTAAPLQLVLRSHKFPWTIVVNPGSGGSTGNNSSPQKMSQSHSRSSSMKGNVITNLDVLHAVHATLIVRVTPEEWEALGNGSKVQRRVTKAYEKRCTSLGGWEGGVRRVDWLGKKAYLSGIEVDKSRGNNVGKLIFSKA